MAGLVAGEAAQDRRAREVEIADRVEHLVAHELVLEAQPSFVHHAVAVDHHGVVERTAARQAVPAQVVDFLQEAEGARPGDVGLELLAVDAARPALPRDHVAFEVDLEVDPEAARRRQAGVAPAVADLDRLEDANRLARRVLHLDPGALDQEHERRGAAVHDRHLRPVELDLGVVHAAGGERAHQVLDRGDLDIAVGDRRAQRRFLAVQVRGAYAGLAVQVAAAEHDAAVGRTGLQRHRDLGPGVEADSRTVDRILERLLVAAVAADDRVADAEGRTTALSVEWM